MPSVTFRIEFKEDDVLFDPTSVVLSNATGAYGVYDDTAAAAVVADGTATTKQSTGSYYYTYSSATAAHVYTAYFEYVVSGETYRSTDTQTAASATAPVLTGEMTGTQVRYQLNTRLNLSLGADEADAYITEALRLISGMGKWPDLHKTDSSTLAFTVGLKSKALPSDFRIVDRLYRADDSTLGESDPDTVRIYQETANAPSGEPTAFAIIGGSVYLYPIPDASYTINLDYWHEPADVTNETAALVLGDEFKEAVVLGTMIQYMKGIGFGTHPKMTETEGLFMAEMEKLRPLEDVTPTIASPFRYA